MEPTSGYGINSNRSGTWIDRYYCAVGLPIFAVALLSGLICFLFGLAVAFTYGFQQHYIRTMLVYLGAFGVGWVSAWIRWGMFNLTDQLDHIRSCFVLDDEAYQAFTDRWLRRLRNNRAAMALSLVVLAIACLVVYQGLFGFREAPDLTKPHVFPSAWYEGNRWMNMILLDLQALPCALVLGTGLWLLLVNGLFLRKVKDLPVVPMPGLLIARLRKITTFYLKIACSWFVGVAIFVFVLFKHLDTTATLVLLVTGSFGLLTFFAPQFVFHSCLVRASALIAHHINELFKQEFHSMFIGSQLSTAGLQHHPTALTRLAEMVQITQTSRMWVYEMKDVAMLLMAQGIGGLAIYFKPHVMPFLRSVLNAIV